ncbi:putative membrane protein required for colicin V production [Rhizomicrobium palustre]|uniref:Putative membrane protein required for colicin V production n=1 Tax=Rhizomicrobium palustre TaxID=189966 RepID=A0A846MVE7_9PROT|nr:CvpA family protein [Rhizomicrobium palustre]NIK87072.1 putative membrane protein required for colicin V production [Rhizomicrobium palustre]
MSLAFQFVDILVVAVILISAIYATYRGLVSESLSIFGWLAAAYAALYIGPYCAGWMRSMIEPAWLGEAVGFVLVFLVVLIPMHFAASRITANVKRSEVGTLDSVLGTGYGVLRGLAVVGIAFLVFMMVFPGRPPSWITNARLYPVIYAAAEIVVSVTPLENPKVDGKPGHKQEAVPEEPARKKPASIKDLLQDQPFGRAKQEREDKASASEKQHSEKAGDDTSATPPQAEQPAAESPHKEKAKSVKSPTKPHTAKKAPADKDQNAAEAGEGKAAASKQGQVSKKTYGAKDRHALDRLIETSHGDESGKP